MTPITLMRGLTLTTGTTSSLALMLVAEALEIEFDLNCSGGPSTVTYYIEYSEDLVTWFAEVAEENAGKGVVSMPKALRTLTDNNSTTIANNTSFRASCQFTRKAQFARVQMSATAGTVAVNSVVAPYGNGPYGTIVTVLASGGGCTPGQTLYDVTFPAEMTIDSGAIMAPTRGVYEIPGFGPFPACTNFQIAIDLDELAVNNVDAGVAAYLNWSGLDLESRQFTVAPPLFMNPFAPAYLTQHTPAPDEGVYHHRTLLNFFTPFEPFANFVGPLPACSVYLWVPVQFPDPEQGQYLVKNVHVKIITI